MDRIALYVFVSSLLPRAFGAGFHGLVGFFWRDDRRVATEALFLFPVRLPGEKEK